MTRIARTRTKTEVLNGLDSRYYAGNLVGLDTAYWTNTSSMSDFHGRPVIDSGLSSTQRKGVSAINGSVNSTYNLGYLYQFDKHPVNSSSLGGLSLSPLVAPSGWYLDTVAGTNPSRPVVTPLTLLQDLVDIPKQLRDVGKLITKPKSLMSPKELANHQLSVQFGWLPLIEDVKQLMNLQSYVQKRTIELNKLRDAASGGLRRRIQISDDTQNASSYDRLALIGPSNYVDAMYDVTVKRRSWATIHWYPTDAPEHRPSDSQNAARARRIVSGLTVEGMAKGAWDVIPWTWLIGWFSNVGKFALANSNTAPASHSGACFMSEVKATASANGIRLTGCANSTLSHTGVYEVTYQTRLVSGSLTPGFNVPFLDTFRLSVLGALAVQRYSR